MAALLSGPLPSCFLPPVTDDPFMSLHARPQHSTIHSTMKHHAQYTITYYRLRPVSNHASKQHPPSLPADSYTRIHVPLQPSQPPSEQPRVRPRLRRHSDVNEERLKAKHRHVHWADEETIIHPSEPPPPRATPPRAPAPPSGKPFVLVQPRRTSVSGISASLPSESATNHALPPLHELLAAFPPGLWDTRRYASPTFSPSYEARFREPVFPASPYTKSLRLVFTLCAHTELSWFASVSLGTHTHLVVSDVLRAISTELFRRAGACCELYSDHPCLARAQAARRRGWLGCAYNEDGVRKVDLYHVERDGALWFRGLVAERLRGGEVVYRVRFSC